MRGYLLLIFMPFLCITLTAQDMSKGFNYLEAGQYKEAERFFADILKDHTNNKTARLCYGRAVGLSGNPEEAVRLFTALLRDYPNDYEVKLNYAESLLWKGNFAEAEIYYKGLIEEQSDNFSAVLGYANALSNVKKYEEAIIWVNNALAIQKNNPNALISRKFIRLGYAFKLAQDLQYDQALVLLDENLIDFPEDRNTLMNKANIYIIKEKFDLALDAYTRIALTRKDSVTSLIGLSLVYHKKKKDKEALKRAEEALNIAEVIAEEELLLSARERHLQALLWNSKYKSAEEKLDTYEKIYPNNGRIQSLRATYGMYTADFKTSVETYAALLDKDDKSFDGNLGIANAYRARGQDMKAYEYAFKTLKYYPKQPDATKLIQALKKSHTPFIENQTAYTFDNGNNIAYNIKFNTEVPLSTKLKALGGYGYRSTENTISNVEATSQEFNVGFNYEFSGRISALFNVGMNSSQAFTQEYTQSLALVQLSLKPFRLQSLDLGYKREMQSFNADLIDREIVMNNLFLNYNLGTNFKLGWFTQGMYTTQSDDNERLLLFTSLYYTFIKKLGLKGGFNYQYISFKEQLPVIYFSPSKFHLYEMFAELSNSIENKWFYNLSAAAGRQVVEEDPASTTFRVEAKLGYYFTDRFITNIYSKYSNIASATAVGFEFTEIGFTLKWYLRRNPTFNKEIMRLKYDDETN